MLKIVFAGTAEFGLPALKALFDVHQIIAVYTQPDKPSGRGLHLTASPIKKWALEHDVSVFQPDSFKNDKDVDALVKLSPDIMVVVAYGLILPQKILSIPKLGCLNVHASLLPNWRGASPIQHAILHGDDVTGVTIMQMDAKMDTGDLLAISSLPLSKDETAGSLHDKLSELAAPLLLNTLTQIINGAANPKKQDHHLATYTKKILKDDARIDWTKSAVALEREVRAYFPWPVSYLSSKMRVLKARVVPSDNNQVAGTVLSLDFNGLVVQTGKDALKIESIQFPGGKVLTVASWLHGHTPTFTKNSVLS